MEETCKVQLFPDEDLVGDRVQKDHDPKTWRPRDMHDLWQEENKYEDTAGGSNPENRIKIRLELGKKKKEQAFLFYTT